MISNNSASNALLRLAPEQRPAQDSVTVSIGSEKVQIPRALLASRSHYFSSLVSENFREASQTQLELSCDEVPHLDTRAFLTYLQTEDLNVVTHENVQGLLQLSDKYHLSPLHERCQDCMIQAVRENPMDYSLDTLKEIANLYNAALLGKFLVLLESDIASVNETLPPLIQTIMWCETQLTENACIHIRGKGKFLKSLKILGEQRLFNFILSCCPNLTELITCQQNLLHFLPSQANADSFRKVTRLGIFNHFGNEDDPLQSTLIDRLPSHFPALQHLDVIGLKGNEPSISSIVSNFPHLTGLTINLNSIKEQRALEELGQLTQLKEVTIKGRYVLQDATLRTIMSALTGVTKLNLRDCVKISSDLLRELCHKYKDTLKSFGCYCGEEDEAAITFVRSIVPDLANLEELDLSGPGFCREALDIFLTNCNKLKFICFFDCGWGNKLIQKFPSCVRDLEVLILDQTPGVINAESITALLELKNLKKLILAHCKLNREVTGSQFIELFKTLPKLRYLEIRGTSMHGFSFDDVDKMKQIAQSRAGTFVW